MATPGPTWSSIAATHRVRLSHPHAWWAATDAFRSVSTSTPCLTLLTNAIVCWNIVFIHATVDRLASVRQTISDEVAGPKRPVGPAVNGTRILSIDAAQSMRRIGVSGKRFQVGLGRFRRGRDQDTLVVEHLGGGAGFWNCMRIYPDVDVGVVIMGNATSYDHDSIAHAAIDHLT